MGGRDGPPSHDRHARDIMRVALDPRIPVDYFAGFGLLRMLADRDPTATLRHVPGELGVAPPSTELVSPCVDARTAHGEGRQRRQGVGEVPAHRPRPRQPVRAAGRGCPDRSGNPPQRAQLYPSIGDLAVVGSARHPRIERRHPGHAAPPDHRAAAVVHDVGGVPQTRHTGCREGVPGGCRNPGRGCP